LKKQGDFRHGWEFSSDHVAEHQPLAFGSWPLAKISSEKAVTAENAKFAEFEKTGETLETPKQSASLLTISQKTPKQNAETKRRNVAETSSQFGHTLPVNARDALHERRTHCSRRLHAPSAQADRFIQLSKIDTASRLPLEGQPPEQLIFPLALRISRQAVGKFARHRRAHVCLKARDSPAIR